MSQNRKQKLSKISQEKIQQIWADKNKYKLLGEGGQAHVYDSAINNENFAIVYYDKRPLGKIKSDKMCETIKKIIEGQMKNKFSLIIKIFDMKIFESDSNKYIIGLIEEKAKMNLENLCEKNLLPQEEIKSIMLQISQGLKQLHDDSIIHRDIKPDNIFVINDTKSEIQIKIGDIGVVKNIQKNPNQHTPINSENYSAPELLTGPHTKAVDIYSLGCVFSDLLQKNEFQNKITQLIGKMKNKQFEQRPQIEDVIKELESINPLEETQKLQPNTQKVEKMTKQKSEPNIYEAQETQKRQKNQQVNKPTNQKFKDSIKIKNQEGNSIAQYDNKRKKTKVQ